MRAISNSLIRVHSSSDFALAVRTTKPGEGDLVYVGYATDVSRWTAEALTAIKECRKRMHEAHPWGQRLWLEIVQYASSNISDMGKITVGTPQQRKDEPSSEVDELWSLIITRCLEGNITNHHYFVIDVVESCLPSSMFCTLGLPPAFMKHYRERLRQHITLQGENGRKWVTMLGLQLDSQYCLNLGWKEFAVDHDLEVNDKLAFFLFEDSHFVVKVFNSSKRKVPGREGDESARMVSQAGLLPKEALLAEETTTTAKLEVQVQAQGSGTSDPLPYHDKNLGSVRAPREVDANPEQRNVIQIPDSSEEDDQLSGRVRRDDMSATPPFRGSVSLPFRGGPSGIKLRTNQNLPKGINREARVGAENQMQATQEDVRDSIKGQTPRQSNQFAEMAEQNKPTQKHDQLYEDQINEGATRLGSGSSRNATADTHPANRSPLSSAGPPSSPEHMPVLKRSTKSQRGYDKDDDYIPDSVKAETISVFSQKRKGRKAALRSENVSVPGVNAECNPVETPTGKPKRGRAASNANKVAESEILAEQLTKKQPRRGQPLQQTAGKVTEDPKIRAPNNKNKKAPESLPKGMKRSQETLLGQPATEGLNATESVAGVVAHDGGTGPMPQENGGSNVLQSAPPQMPGVGSRTTVKQSHKVKVHKGKGDKNKEKACPPPEETLSPPKEEPTTVFKRPTKIARLGPAKPHKLIYVSRRRPVTDQERNDTLAKAQEYAQSRSAINKHSVIQLRITQVYCGYHLGVPPGFVEALQLPLAKEKMTFYDATGKTWEVVWQGDHHMKPGFNSFGWTKFVLDHCLEDGDVCVFELPDPKVFNISVTIFPIVPLTTIPELGWKSHYGGEHTGEKSGLATPSQG